MICPPQAEETKREKESSVKEPSKAGIEYVPTVEAKEGLDKLTIEAAMTTGKEGTKAPDNPPETSDKMSKDEQFISPGNNETYHEKILNLLKIANNKALNALYYNVVPMLSKNALLMLDLSLAPQVLRQTKYRTCG